MGVTPTDDEIKAYMDARNKRHNDIHAANAISDETIKRKTVERVNDTFNKTIHAIDASVHHRVEEEALAAAEI